MDSTVVCRRALGCEWGDIKSDRCFQPLGPGGEPERMGWCYAHAEGSGATSEGSGRVACQRGLHKDAALVS